MLCRLLWSNTQCELLSSLAFPLLVISFKFCAMVTAGHHQLDVLRVQLQLVRANSPFALPGKVRAKSGSGPFSTLQGIRRQAGGRKVILVKVVPFVALLLPARLSGLSLQHVYR